MIISQKLLKYNYKIIKIFIIKSYKPEINLKILKLQIKHNLTIQIMKLYKKLTKD